MKKSDTECKFSSANRFRTSAITAASSAVTIFYRGSKLAPVSTTSTTYPRVALVMLEIRIRYSCYLERSSI